MIRLKYLRRLVLTWTAPWLVCVVVSSACGSEEEGGAANPAMGAGVGAGTGGASGNAGTGSGGVGGDGDGTDCPVTIVQDQGSPCINSGEDNLECLSADVNAPFEGACAPKGPSCHRSSNRAKQCMLGPNDPYILEFRVASSIPINMPKSSGLPLLEMYALERAKRCDSEQCLLLRTSAPRMNGEQVAGQGTAEIAVGRYNCDGTFSFYGDNAAPERPDDGRTGANRWAVRPVMTDIDPTKDGRERSTVIGLNTNRFPSCSPFYAAGASTVDWEICTQGFDLVELDTSDEAGDGVGSFANGAWDRPGLYVTYAPIAHNDGDVIDPLGITFCQLLSFGPLAADLRATTTCSGTPRCMPDTADCPYVKLPDSLCPTEAEAGMFGCHLGVKANVNNEEGYPTDVSCTMTAPTSPLGDNDGGQCCDPLGAGTDGLPACNSFRIMNAYAASAIEITDQPSNELQPVCP